MKQKNILFIFLSLFFYNIALAEYPCLTSSGEGSYPICGSSGDMAVSNVTNRITETDALTVTAGAYSAKDVVGGLQSLTCGRDPQFSCVIRSITVADKAAQGKNLRVHFFASEPSTIADNAAFDPTDADLFLKVGICNITQHQSYTDNGDSVNTDCDLHVDIATATLYYYIEAIEAPTYASTSDVQVKIVVEQD